MICLKLRNVSILVHVATLGSSYITASEEKWTGGWEQIPISCSELPDVAHLKRHDLRWVAIVHTTPVQPF